MPNISDLTITSKPFGSAKDYTFTPNAIGTFYVRLVKTPQVPFQVSYNGMHYSFPTFTVLGFAPVDGLHFTGNVRVMPSANGIAMQIINGHYLSNGDPTESVHLGDSVVISWSLDGVTWSDTITMTL